MVQSRAEWEALQRRLPPEERESYESYLSGQGYSYAPPTKIAAMESGTIGAASIEAQNKFELSLEALETKAENAADAASDAAADARQAVLDRLKKETEAKEAERKAKLAKSAAERAKAAAAAKKAREEAARLREEEQNLKRIADAAKRAEEAARRAAEVAARRKAEEDAAAEKAAKEAADKAEAEAKAAQEAADKAAAQAKADADAAEAALAAAKTAEEKAAAEAAAQKAAEDAAAAEAAQKAADEAAAAAKLEKEAAEAAAKAAAEAAALKETLAATAAVTAAVTTAATATTTSATTVVVTPPEESLYVFTGGILYYNGTPYTGTYQGKEFKDGILVTAAVTAVATAAVTAAVTAVATAAVTAAVTAVATAAVTAAVTTAATVIVTPVTTTAATVTITPTATVTTTATSVVSAYDINRVSAIKALQDRFAKYGLSGLANKILELAQEGATEATITLQLAETPEYQMRFRANEQRLKKGLTVLTPAEYLNLEDGYRQILRAYGLKQFDSDDYVSQFIANDVSPAELSNRVVTAVQRVQNADPAIAKTLRDFYGIGTNDLVAYVLDPDQQFQKIERQVAAAEIGTAARLQGIEAGVGTAEALAAQGITQAEARRGYSTIADILPTAEKLSQIYGGVEESYGLAEAEQEVFNSLAEAQRRRQRLTAREIASFGGATGVGRTSLTQTDRGQF